jgi:hypothetical protein
MNAYPSWIHRIPEMIEILALTGAEHIDRQLVERLFDLRGTAAKALLRRMGAERCGHSFIINRGLLMARLREALENPDWQWEARRKQTIRDRIDSSCPQPRRHSVVPLSTALQKKLQDLTVASLPSTIRLLPGAVVIHCQGMEHLLEQLVLLAKTLDNDYETLQKRIEEIAVRRPVGSATATAVPADQANTA